MNLPGIYTMNCRNIIGTVGSNSFEVKQPVCSNCNRTLPEEIKFSHIEYLIDEYHNEDMFTSLGQLIVTEQLYQALYSDNIKGFVPLKVSLVKSKYHKSKAEKMPECTYLAVLPPQIKNIPIAYEFEKICPVCNFGIMDINTLKPALFIRTDLENKQPVNIYFNSWNGNDIFDLSDHGEVAITQKFLDIIQKFDCPEVLTFPAKWI